MRQCRIALLALVASVFVPGLTVIADTYEDASAAFQAGDYALAAEKFELLVEESPNWSPGYVVLGQCYYMTDRADLGNETILKAAEVDPETELFQAYFSVGQMLYKQQRYGEASLPLERALEYTDDTTRTSTALNLAYSCLRAGEAQKARTTIENLQTASGPDAVTSFYLALACQKLDDYPCALKSLRTGNELGGEGVQAAQVREYLAKWSHHWALLPANKATRKALLEEAVVDTSGWFEADPDNPTAVRYYGETLLAAGRSDQIIDLFGAAAEGGSCSAQVILAKAFNSRGNADDARTWASRAAVCDPSSAEPQVQLASAAILQLKSEHSSVDQVRADLARIRESVAALERALELDPGHAHAKSLLADARKTLTDLARAETVFVDRQQAYQQALEEADAENIRRQCRAILWKIETESETLTPEEEAFHKEHNCRQYAESGAD